MRQRPRESSTRIVSSQGRWIILAREGLRVVVPGEAPPRVLDTDVRILLGVDPGRKVAGQIQVPPAFPDSPVEGSLKPNLEAPVVDAAGTSPSLHLVGDSQVYPQPTRSRLAWRHREQLLSPTGRPALARRFVDLSRAHARDHYSVPEAARDLGVGRRTLERCSVAWFDLSPALIIHLVRILSVSNDLRDSDEPLKAIAEKHAFRSPSNFGRMFARFVGVPPRLYRQLSRLRPLTQFGQRLTQTEY
jgi:AraC-like DNA-binding protein